MESEREIKTVGQPRTAGMPMTIVKPLSVPHTTVALQDFTTCSHPSKQGDGWSWMTFHPRVTYANRAGQVGGKMQWINVHFAARKEANEPTCNRDSTHGKRSNRGAPTICHSGQARKFYQGKGSQVRRDVAIQLSRPEDVHFIYRGLHIDSFPISNCRIFFSLISPMTSFSFSIKHGQYICFPSFKLFPDRKGLSFSASHQSLIHDYGGQRRGIGTCTLHWVAGL